MDSLMIMGVIENSCVYLNIFMDYFRAQNSVILVLNGSIQAE